MLIKAAFNFLLYKCFITEKYYTRSKSAVDAEHVRLGRERLRLVQVFHRYIKVWFLVCAKQTAVELRLWVPLNIVTHLFAIPWELWTDNQNTESNGYILLILFPLWKKNCSGLPVYMWLGCKTGEKSEWRVGGAKLWMNLHPHVSSWIPLRKI